MKLCVEWSKRTAHSLRLTSFIFGVRDPTEEISHVRSTWRAKLTLKKAHEGGDVGAAPNDAVTGRDVYAKRDGGFVRVPASDAVHIAPGRKMLVPVTEEGHPVDEEGSRIIAAQLVEMASTRKNDKYQVVSSRCVWVRGTWLIQPRAGLRPAELPFALGPLHLPFLVRRIVFSLKLYPRSA